MDPPPVGLCRAISGLWLILNLNRSNGTHQKTENCGTYYREHPRAVKWTVRDAGIFILSER